jgi:hypothetical protein
LQREQPELASLASLGRVLNSWAGFGHSVMIAHA